MSILALCPSRGRPKAAAETLVSFNATKRDRNSRIVFIVDSDDPTLADYPARFTHVVKPTGSMGGALRAAQAEVIGDATSVGMIGDDNRFRTPGWDVILDTHLTERIGVAYGDDGFQHERLPTSWWVSRKLVDVFPLAPPMLTHLYMDNWWKSLGEGAGCLRYFPDIDIEHLHPIAGKAPDDPTYRRGNSRVNINHDRDAFRRWERRERVNDVRRARSIIGGGQKRRILADWHHPALWESLAILFEDRFGWELYSMGGNDWTKHGWILKSGPPIGWSEADYLCMDGAVQKGDHWELTEKEYPKRPRKMMTPDQAFATQWHFVLGSVPEHQRSFSTLAKKVGARFIHQVGNAKHEVVQGPDQLILASAKVRIRDRTPHVTYHQEFDRSVFAPSPITNPLAVTSLMLRLDWTSCDYRWLAEAPGITWSAPGGADPMSPDYLAPMS
ncbi:MAG TPA: hypothetical protein VFB99_12620, partial [Vicinamibacterales bacterium]|nr:hypothetical protein [Vicinamibacterales bacterium]